MYSFGLLLQRLFTGSSPSSLAEQPLTRARLMDAMGVVYTNLGLYDEALPLLQEAADLRAARACWEEALGAVAGIAREGGAVAFRNARAKALLLLDRVDEARPVVSGLLATGWSDPDLLALGRANGLAIPPGK